MEHTCQEPFDSGPGLCGICQLRPAVSGLKRCSRIVAESAAMQALLVKVAPIAATSASVIVLGETGTGKEVVARALHANSPRRSKPFVAVNVAALPGELLESELFGHAKGAFTGATSTKTGLFEEADGGSLFLDEIAEMPLGLQAKLLRVLQEGEIRRVGDTRVFGVDVRIVCATHRSLAQLVDQDRFRRDLYYRLKVFALSVPPLRERREDILPLARLFAEQCGRPDVRFTRRTRAALDAYAWPGTVRELANAIEHAVVLAGQADVDVEHLPEEVVATGKPSGPRATGVHRTLEEVEREHVLRVLDACGGNQVETARALGIGRNTLWRKLRAWSAG